MIANVMAVSLNDFIADVLGYEQSVKEASLINTSQQHTQVISTHTQYNCSQYVTNCNKCINTPSCNQYCVNAYCSKTYCYVTSTSCNDVTNGFNHNNHIPSIPYIYNEAQKLGKPLRDTATINVFSYDGNLQDGLGTQDTQSKDIYFSVELKKLSNFDGSAVSAADAAWHYVGNFQKSPLVDGNSITHSPIAAQKADSNGMTSFTINTRNPFGKATYDYRTEEGVYQLRVVAWNTYLSANSVTKYYVSSTRYETLEFKQNFTPEVELTNESSIRSFVFSNHGVKTGAPSFKAWADDVYHNDYATAQNQTEGIFVRFSMRDLDTEGISIANWQTGKAFLRKSDGTEIAQTDVWFSDSVSKGDRITQSNGEWKTGYAYFGNWLFPENTDLTDCTVTVQIWDYLNAACTDAIGTYQVALTKLDIDTKIPALVNVTQSTPGLNTSTVKAGVGVVNSVYAMKFKINASDSHPNTKIGTVKYAITNDNVFPSNLTTAAIDSSGYFITPEITKNGTYYVHVYVQDYAGNPHRATYGPYTRMFEPELVGSGDGGSGVGSGSGIYLAEMKSAGKTHTFGSKDISGVSDLGLPLSAGLNFWYKQGYAFILRVAAVNADGIELSLKYGDTVLPVQFLGSRKFEVPDGAMAVLPSLTDAGNVKKDTVSVGSILPPVVTDPDGHLVCDTNSVYVAEFQVYLHRNVVLDTGSSNLDKALSISVKLTGQLKYPAGHPLAGQNVYIEENINDALLISNNVTVDGGTNNTN